MRKVEDMHWHLWEAIVMQAQDMYHKGLVSKQIDSEVTAICREVRSTGKFCEQLRIRAILIEGLLEANSEEWQEQVAKEYEET